MRRLMIIGTIVVVALGLAACSGNVTGVAPDQAQNTQVVEDLLRREITRDVNSTGTITNFAIEKAECVEAGDLVFECYIEATSTEGGREKVTYTVTCDESQMCVWRETAYSQG
jgi:hypothetical protein